MGEEKRKRIDAALESAGLKTGRIAIGLYESEQEGHIGVYFHYRFTEELANALINLAMQDESVREGLKDLRQNFDLVIKALEGAETINDKERLH